MVLTVRKSVKDSVNNFLLCFRVNGYNTEVLSPFFQNAATSTDIGICLPFENGGLTYRKEGLLLKHIHSCNSRSYKGREVNISMSDLFPLNEYTITFFTPGFLERFLPSLN